MYLLVIKRCIWDDLFYLNSVICVIGEKYSTRSRVKRKNARPTSTLSVAIASINSPYVSFAAHFLNLLYVTLLKVTQR